ncbi:hypothetical protein L915_02986, partial [Phytophthora nicotianae]
ADVAKEQWSPNEFIANIQYPNKYDDVTFQKTFKMVKNRFRDAFGYYNTIRKELSKQNKAAKLDNELTPKEEKKYISYEELMSVPGKVAK